MCLCYGVGQFEDLNPFRPPLARWVLVGRYPDFLASPETICIAVMMFAGRYFLSIDNLSMGNFHPAQHAISALDKDPAFDHRLTWRRIGDLAAERPIDREHSRSP